MRGDRGLTRKTAGESLLPVPEYQPDDFGFVKDVVLPSDKVLTESVGPVWPLLSNASHRVGGVLGDPGNRDLLTRVAVASLIGSSLSGLDNDDERARRDRRLRMLLGGLLGGGAGLLYHSWMSNRGSN
ncbi:MAG: hypothetical protein KatS3mg109_0066 [Pirellulaceae bacterium]|nr:MAG: hypothetical protein KatS3mg109_0066 [Pirellulaceae bacterium]